MATLQEKIRRVSSVSAEALADRSETEESSRGVAPDARQILGALFGLLMRHKRFVIGSIVIIAVSFGIYEKYFNLTDAERAQKELKAAMSAVSKHMILPEGDEPVLATVTDAEALTAQQAFFTGAVNGDQLLLFPRNLKAVIYSPSRERIVNAGPIEQSPAVAGDKSQITNPKSQTNSNVQNSNVQNMLTVEVRNSTGKPGLAAEVAENLRAAGFEVVAVTDAKNKKYPKTILVTKTNDGVKSELAAALAVQIGAELISDLPDGEKNTNADVLIILGGE